MSNTDPANVPQLEFYKAGDTLRVCKPGDTVSLWEKTGSLLLLRLDEQELDARTHNHFVAAKWLYIGDVVTRRPKTVAYGTKYSSKDKINGLGKTSMIRLNNFLEPAGLCLGLNVPDWPPKNIKEIEQQYSSSIRGSLPFHLQGVIRPGGVE